MSEPIGPGFLNRRKALQTIGTAGAVLVVGACAGASHPHYALAAGQQQGSVLRLSVKQMQFPPDGVLQVEPGGGYPKLLVRRDADGSYGVITAKCTHFGCVVAWDAAAKNWTCPCHGSVFAADGKVVKGPASEPLVAPAHRMEGDILVVELPAKS
jgi:Rieske Fe-S protein